ncbi:MAG: hypothetical protein WBI29_03135 [Candidatus Saccharimonadales bacterium]
MSEQEPVIPESYVTDKDKAETMATMEDGPQMSLSKKLRGEDGDTSPVELDKLRHAIKRSGERSSRYYDMMKPIDDYMKAHPDAIESSFEAQPIAESENEGIKSDEKRIRNEDYIEEHPDAVVDPSEAMVIAEATKSREEEISKLKQEAYEIIEKGQSVPGAVVDTIQEKREETDTAAKQASDIYRI